MGFKNILRLNKKTILKKLGFKKEKEQEQKQNAQEQEQDDNYVFTSNIKEGDKVTLVSNYQTFSDSAEGPLKLGDVGIVMENDKSYKPFKIEFNDKTWWYDEKAVELYDETNVNDKKSVVEAAEPVFTSNIKEGDKVTLVSNYQTFSDSAEGPLKPGDVGIVMENDKSYKPFKIEFNDKTWWYDVKAVELYDETNENDKKSVVEAAEPVVEAAEPVVEAAEPVVEAAEDK